MCQKWYESGQRGKGVKYNVQLGYFFFLFYFSCQALENTFLGASLYFFVLDDVFQWRLIS